MSTGTREERVRGAGEAWKGTVVLVGLLGLLMLLEGCYTVVASERMLPRVGFDDRELAAEEADRLAVDVKTDRVEENLSRKMNAFGLAPEPETAAVTGTNPAEEPQSLGVGWSEDLYTGGSKGVGVRYRDDLDYSGERYTEYVYDYDLDLVVVGYRRPWFRRLYVDWYYSTCYGWHRFPRRFGHVWSAGYWWGGFGISMGYYDPWWYDPYYWDYWWTDPWYISPWYSPWYGSCYSVCYVDPWWFGWRPYHHGFYDPYWGSYWYYDHPYHWGGGTVIVADDYQRRAYDRRRGLSDLRTARGARGVAADAGGAGSERGSPVGRAVADAANVRSAARGRRDADRGAQTDSRSDYSRSRNPATSSIVRNGKIRVRPDDSAATRDLRLPSSATRTATRRPSTSTTTARKPRTSSGSDSGSRTLIRDLGGRLIRTATGNTRSASGSSRTSTGSSRTSSGSSSSGSRTSVRVVRPRTSRPPPTTSGSSSRTTSSGATSSRTTSSRATSSRTTSSRTTSSRTTSGRTSSGRTTTSRPPPRTTSHRPPPASSSSSSRTTSSRTTSSRATSSRTTSSRTTSGRTSSGRTTTSRPPPRTTGHRPPPGDDLDSREGH